MAVDLLGRTKVGTFTNNEGTFIVDLPPGRYRIIIRTRRFFQEFVVDIGEQPIQKIFSVNW